MGICNDHSSILIERNLECGLNTLHNLIIDNGDAEVVKEKQTRVKNFRNEMALRFKKEMQNNTEKIPITSFKSIIPEKYEKYLQLNPMEVTYQGDSSNLLTEEPVKFPNGSLYWGSWNDQCEIEGQGKMFMSQSNAYVEGIWKKGVMVSGKILYPDESVYEGEIKDSTFHGQGKLTYSDGSIYEGEFKQGAREGRGSMNWPDGSKYWGEFLKDQMHGEGELIWSDGFNYKGKFKWNKLEGKGILTGPNKSKYTGKFFGNMFNGQGRYNWGSTNQLYHGGYTLGKRNGNGKFIIKKGQAFKGTFVNGLPHGPGEIITDTTKYKGFWRNGELIEQGDQIARDVESLRPRTLESNVEEEMPEFNFIAPPEDLNPLELKYLDHSPIDMTPNEFISNQAKHKGSKRKKEQV